MKLFYSLYSLTAIAMPKFTYEAADRIVDALPPKLPLMQLLPQNIIDINDRLYEPYLYLERNCSLSNNTSVLIAGPIYEELIYRVGIQKILLTDIPKAIFHDHPTIQTFLESNVARATRVAIATLMFVALHYSPTRDSIPGSEELGNMSFVCTSLFGLWSGILMESTNASRYSIITHIAHNVFARFFY